MPVTSEHPEYSEMKDSWRDCRLLYRGESAVKSEGTHFIPKPEDCTNKEYANYVQRAFFFPAMERTVSGLSGAIDRKEPTVVVPDKISYILNNCDGNNASLRQLSKVVLDEVFITGRCGILIDRDEAGGPPYLSVYHAEDIINWSVDENNSLEFVVLKEVYYARDTGDPFALTSRIRYRVLRMDNGIYVQDLYDWLSNDEIKSITEPITPKKAGVALNYIPFVFCNARSLSTKVDKPPLLDLAYKNIEHLRVCADYANALYFTGNPILWASGVKRPSSGKVTEANEPNFKISIGSSRAVILPREAQIGLLECSGHGVNPNRDRANDIKLEMAVIGARLLENQRSGVETAETAMIRQSGELSTLSNIVVNCSNGIRKALTYVADWERASGKISFNLNNDFIVTTMNPQLLTALRELVAGEYISWDTFYYNLALGELTVPNRTPEQEKALIETQSPGSGAVFGGFSQEEETQSEDVQE